jgi:hypothetical protein
MKFEIGFQSVDLSDQEWYPPVEAARHIQFNGRERFRVADTTYPVVRIQLWYDTNHRRHTLG